MTRFVFGSTVFVPNLVYRGQAACSGSSRLPVVVVANSLRRSSVADPYNARHTSVTWNLMLAKNPLWVAKQHGHSVHIVLETYAARLEVTTE